MNLNTMMSAQDQSKLNMQVDTFNKALANGKMGSQSLDKDDFLKILITQLSHQDPTEPMDDKEFVAQMAQFSSLEQMNNMSKSMTDLSEKLLSGQAMNYLGKNVSINTAAGPVTGQVEKVTAGQYPQLLVNGAYYDFDKIETVSEK